MCPYSQARHDPENEPAWPVWLIVGAGVLTGVAACALLVTAALWVIGVL